MKSQCDHFTLSLALTDWWWNSRDQWWDHQKHETFSGHRTDKEWWPQSSSVSEAGRRLSPGIWWVKLWKHPFLPWHDSMSLSPERQQESLFVSLFTSVLPASCTMWLFASLVLKPLHISSFACLHGLGHGLRQDLDSPLFDNQREHSV